MGDPASESGGTRTLPENSPTPSLGRVVGSIAGSTGTHGCDRASVRWLAQWHFPFAFEAFSLVLIAFNFLTVAVVHLEFLLDRRAPEFGASKPLSIEVDSGSALSMFVAAARRVTGIGKIWGYE